MPRHWMASASREGRSCIHNSSSLSMVNTSLPCMSLRSLIPPTLGSTCFAYRSLRRHRLDRNPRRNRYQRVVGFPLNHPSTLIGAPTMKVLISVLSLVGLAMVSAAPAQQPFIELGTPDGDPPSVETVCDGEFGRAFGLCSAYCEAMDCDLANDGDPNTSPNASNTACGNIRDKYMRVTGEDLPCEQSWVCPCADNGFADWDDLGKVGCTSFEVPCPECGTDYFGLAALNAGFFPVAWLNNGDDNELPPNGCGVLLLGSYVAITPQQAQSCISLIQESCD